jgi:GT2 family glycosyltransferase
MKIKHWFRYRTDPKSGLLSSDSIVDAEVLNGVCLLIRSQCLREIGLFDDRIFMYIEDIDMQHRAHAQGWRVQYLPIDSVIHDQKEAGYNLTGNVGFLLKRNTVYFLNKIGKRFDAVGFAVLSVGLTLLRAVIPFNRDGETFGSYIRLAKRLITAYIAILTGCLQSKEFGPPY